MKSSSSEKEEDLSKYMATLEENEDNNEEKLVNLRVSKT